MISNLAYYPILGLPLILYLGVITFFVLVSAVITGVRGAPIKVHKTLATITMVLALIHGLLALSLYLGW